MHQIDILDERPPQSASYSITTSISDQTPADFLLYLLSEQLQPRLDLFSDQTALELREVFARHERLDQLLLQISHVKTTQGAIQVVRASNGPARFHARQPVDRLSCTFSQSLFVEALERFHERAEKLIEIEVRITLRGLVLLEVLAFLFFSRLDVGGWDMREVDVESGVEGPLVTQVLDQRRSKRFTERNAIAHVDRLDSLHAVDGLDHRDRDTRGPKLVDEAGQDSEHFTPAELKSVLWRPSRCRPGT